MFGGGSGGGQAGGAPAAGGAAPPQGAAAPQGGYSEQAAQPQPCEGEMGQFLQCSMNGKSS